MGRTVAICQVGGEFVANSDGSMSYTGGEAYAVPVVPNMKFDEFKSEIAEMCNRDTSTLSIKYFLPSNRRTPITISNDKHMRFMVDFHEDSTTIDVFVLDGEAVAQNAVKTVNKRASRAASRTASRTTATAGTDRIPPIPTTIGNDWTARTSVPDPITPTAATVATDGGDRTVSTTVPDPVTPTAATFATDSGDRTGRTRVPDPITPTATTVATNGGDRTVRTTVPDPITPTAATVVANGGDRTASPSGGESGDRTVGTTFPYPITPTAATVGNGSDRTVRTTAADPTATTVTALGNDKRPGWLFSSTDSLIADVGQEFNSVNDVREALRRYALTKGFRCVFIKNESRRVTAKCKAEGCPWRVHASRLSTMLKFKIKTIKNVHTCGGGVGKGNHPHVTSNWVASIIKDKVRDTPQYKPKEIVDDIYREYGVNLKYHQAWNAKEMAQVLLQDSQAEAYKQLPWLCEKIRETNPGSLVTLTTTDESRFHRLFVSFHASLHGFETGCRPLILLDGTSLRDKCQGTLLAAASVDADDGIFPLAFAIVDSESYDNWHWFLAELKLAMSTNRTITFVSDRHNGLDVAVPQVFKDSYHAYSMHHLTEDFKRLSNGQLQMMKDALVDEFKRAAYSFGITNFNACIESIRNVSHDLAAWVLESKPEHWSNAFFRGLRYDHVSSNVAELFYDWIPEEHKLSIIQAVDMIRCKMMEMIYMRREASSAWSTILTPSMEQRLQLEIYNSRSLSVLFLSGSMFEVRDDSVNTVDIETWDCTCRRWKVSGLPCIHAAAVFDRTGRNMYDYCSRYFTADCYRLAYSESINPIPVIGKHLSEDSNTPMIVYPPCIHQPRHQPRWPKKKRKNPSKKLRLLHCSGCRGAGHNRATCGEPE